MAQNLYCNPSDVTNLFPMDTGFSVVALRLAIQMASSYIENFTQRLLLSATYTHEEGPLIINRRNEVVGRVRQWPITAVTAVSILPQGLQNIPQNEMQLDPTYVDFQSPPERLFYYSGGLYPSTGGSPSPYNYGGIHKGMRGRMFATYTGGYTSIPEDIRTACILLTHYFLMRQANAMGAMSISVSAPSSSNSISFGKRSTMLDDAEQLLMPYKRME